ncbi:MAG: tyrosine--tRNA ligase [Candidatus Omnitrophica bacterium]|nr:tyrosine--tRNA ligase [Candidatus Omnitrophota bacterium]
MPKADVNEQIGLIKRGTVEIIEEGQLKEKIKKSISEKRPLVVKAGFDPSAPDIHLGHTVLLRKLAHFQKLGHKVIFLIGDATALVGDPSGQSQTRKMLTQLEVEKNAATYEKQVSKILDTKSQKIFSRMHNNDWFSKFDFGKFVNLSQKYTVARLLERDDFEKRLKENKPISFLELFYPLMQGYDSVQLKSDIEIGGTDQKFNMLVGRDLQRSYDQEPQIVITMPLLEGTDGVQKMSKSLGNYIGINESPKEMFGKIMSISDELMWKYYELLTDVSMDEIAAMKKDASENRLNPKDAKVKLAKIIIEFYHSKDAAKKAEEEFENVFKKRGLPEDIQDYSTDETERLVWELIKNAQLASTSSEAIRDIKQGAVSIDGAKVIDINAKVKPKDGMILKVGKRLFRRISIRRAP